MVKGTARHLIRQASNLTSFLCKTAAKARQIESSLICDGAVTRDNNSFKWSDSHLSRGQFSYIQRRAAF